MGAILIFSLSDRASFGNIKTLTNIIKNNISSNIPIVLVGNKKDNEAEVVSSEEAHNLAEECEVMYFEVSAKENLNIKEPFLELVNQIENQFGKGNVVSKSMTDLIEEFNSRVNKGLSSINVKIQGISQNGFLVLIFQQKVWKSTHNGEALM